MSVGNSGNPRDAVFTTALWDGAFALADWGLHAQRLAENAKRLRLELPQDMAQQLSDFFEKEKLQHGPSLEPSMLVRIECFRTGEMAIEVRKISFRNEEIDAITLPAPRWSSKVNGTKHGDWKPYQEAHELAEKRGADLAFLIHDYAIVDADRAMPIVLDDDGTAWVAAQDEGGVASITLDILIEGLEAAGIPVHFGRLNERLVARAAEVVAVGSGIGACRVLSLDDEMLGEGVTLSKRCQSLLESHYQDKATWFDVRSAL
ncbi:MAG: aminotransferase class IV [Candidatus Poseidoniaceae archaeon]|nr:aminotransferase class IV [Candidatus Poseidoniaceae archaeon]